MIMGKKQDVDKRFMELMARVQIELSIANVRALDEATLIEIANVCGTANTIAQNYLRTRSLQARGGMKKRKTK
jgi:hypothetical protein